MPRLKPVDPVAATGEVKELFEGIERKLGRVPKLMQGLANSPAALRAYLAIGEALSRGVLPAPLRERIALVVAETNGCRYCLSAHTAIGKMVGLTDDQVAASREGRATDPKTAAILRLARVLVENRGNVSNDHLRDIRQAGLTDAEITEVVAAVAHNTFSNYFNHVAQTEVDFPEVAPGLKQPA
jgi:uncharacterized peroxidase-related enzyme